MKDTSTKTGMIETKAYMKHAPRRKWEINIMDTIDGDYFALLTSPIYRSRDACRKAALALVRKRNSTKGE